jgi:hypothetical protein
MKESLIPFPVNMPGDWRDCNEKENSGVRNVHEYYVIYEYNTIHHDNLPVLHCVRYVNGGFAIHFIRLAFVDEISTVALLEGFVPTDISKFLQIFVHDIRRHDRGDYQMAKAL